MSNTEPNETTDEYKQPGTEMQNNISSDASKATLSVENIGGITDCTVTFTPGVTILTGENATNRTSFLSALNGALGGSEAAVKTDSKLASVELALESSEGTTRFDRRYERSRGRTRAVGGTPVSDDIDLVDTFVTLLETNDARLAAQQGDDIRDILMRPVDVSEIERELREKTQTRQSLKRDYQETLSTADREQEVVERREELSAELRKVGKKITELENQVEEYEANEEMAQEAEELIDRVESKRDEINEIETEINFIQGDIEDVKESKTEAVSGIVELYETATGEDVEDPESIDDVTEELPLEKLSFTGSSSKDELESELSQLRAEKSELSDTVSDLESIVQFTESTLNNVDEISLVQPDNVDVTAQLAPGGGEEQVNCWTCGTTVDQQTISSRTDELRSVISDKNSSIESLESDIESAKSKLSEFRWRQNEYQTLKRKLIECDKQLPQLNTELEDAQSEADRARDELQELQQAVANTEELRESDLQELYEQLSDAQYKRGTLETEFSDVEDELDSIAQARDRCDKLQSETDAITEEIDSLRTRVEESEQDVVESFNTHMEALLDRLNYDNISRVWIERLVTESNGKALETGEFELHVIRETDDDGAVYEDRVENLSESEREIVGLITALAGYIVHDVAEQIPFLIIDSIEAIDSSRIVSLIDYLSSTVTDDSTFITAALLPEDSGAFDDRYERIRAEALSTDP